MALSPAPLHCLSLTEEMGTPRWSGKDLTQCPQLFSRLPYTCVIIYNLHSFVSTENLMKCIDDLLVQMFYSLVVKYRCNTLVSAHQEFPISGLHLEHSVSPHQPSQNLESQLPKEVTELKQCAVMLTHYLSIYIFCTFYFEKKTRKKRHFSEFHSLLQF